MEHRMIIGLVLVMTTLSGCVGEWFVIRTVEEIQRSEYHAEYASPKTPDTVTRCMMETLYSHTDAKGKRPYAEVSTQTFGATQTIMLKTGQNLATRMYGGGDEIQFFIENSARDGGTKSKVWANQMILPSPQKYLDTIAGVVRVCL